MSLRDTLGRLFQTEGHAARSAAKWADDYFPDQGCVIARCVVLSVANFLCVPVSHVKPDTNLVKDLRVDEGSEWIMIRPHIEETVGRKFGADVQLVAGTISELIDFTFRHLGRPKE